MKKRAVVQIKRGTDAYPFSDRKKKVEGEVEKRFIGLYCIKHTFTCRAKSNRSSRGITMKKKAEPDLREKYILLWIFNRYCVITTETFTHEV